MTTTSESPPDKIIKFGLNRSSEVQRFECSDAMDKIMFVFYPGLPHVHVGVREGILSYVYILILYRGHRKKMAVNA